MNKQPEYSQELCTKLLPLFQEGRAIIEVCQALGITKNTYYQWKADHLDFREAADFAEEASEAALLKLGRIALFSNGKIKLDNTLYSFILKTRFGYQETKEILSATESEKGQPISINFNVLPPVGEVTITNANPDF
ncbi:transposase [Legionella gresilensis]|uniref:transposase n=1 Tax=Legionella gresilensis TaxID=91823 RepID=UPI001040E979|nr:transposase [Legionella gresilensis]